MRYRRHAGQPFSLDHRRGALQTHLPAVLLNHAAAVGMAEGPQQGLVLLNGLDASGSLDSYHLYAARADLLRRLSRREEALIEYQRALTLTANAVERRYLRRRMNELGALHNTI